MPIAPSIIVAMGVRIIAVRRTVVVVTAISMMLPPLMTLVAVAIVISRVARGWIQQGKCCSKELPAIRIASVPLTYLPPFLLPFRWFPVRARF